jgi:orotate phosphoribosyltransferase
MSASVRTEAEHKLLQILTERSFRRGRFVLASGAVSDYYMDGKASEVDSAGAFFIGKVIYDRLKDLDIDAIGGLEVGAVPLTTAAVIHYHLNNRTMEGFWVRDKVKAHGTRKLIEGRAIRAGDRVVIVDDVFTTGGSALKAVQAVRELGAEVVMVLALVDRLRGAAEAFAREGVANYQTVFDIRDFGIDPDVPDATAAAVREEHVRPGSDRSD